jgi:hypothetical protein
MLRASISPFLSFPTTGSGSADHTTFSGGIRCRRTEVLGGEHGRVEIRLSPVAMRLAGLAALFVALGSLLSAESGIGAHPAGAIVLGFCALMIAIHLLSQRTTTGAVPPPESLLAALFAAVTLVPGLLLVFWQRPGLNATYLLIFGVSNNAASNAFLAAAAVAAAVYLAGRQPRWLLLAPLALVAGVQFRITTGHGQVSLGSGSWPRFLVFLAAVALLIWLGRWAGGAVERNLVIAAALLAPFTFESVPAAHGHAVRDLVGVAMLVALAVIVRNRVTLGTGAGFVLLGLVEVLSLEARGSSKVPAVLFALAGAGLLALSLVPAGRPDPDDQPSA